MALCLVQEIYGKPRADTIYKKKKLIKSLSDNL